MQNNHEDSINKKLYDDGFTRAEAAEDNRDKVLRATTSGLTDSGDMEAIIKEIYIEATFWNKVKLFFANTYEITLLCMGLALSIYDDDITSLIF